MENVHKNFILETRHLVLENCLKITFILSPQPEKNVKSLFGPISKIRNFDTKSVLVSRMLSYTEKVTQT